MNYYKSTIQYDGTNYAGFQWQKDIPTIQNDFNIALKKLIPGKITTLGASRTDSGVHALEQIIKVTSEHDIEIRSAINRMNEVLPGQLRCLDFQSCPGDFRPTSMCISKEYRYLFTNKKIVSSLEQRFIANFAYNLNFDAMKVCTTYLVGEHNFQNFYSAGSNVTNTIRKIIHCDLSQVNPHNIFEGSSIFKIPNDIHECYQLRIIGNGFLKQMVRHIMSALWMVGSGKIGENDFLNLVKGEKKIQRIWKVAPPNGLFLYKINYQPEFLA
ncbi:MAG: tRNA pseudouridine(38-40) synthase TruA [Bacteriovoracaceae bacterium]|nr:tRNA pseudouridine(38-40) synthase TruA [Bacteriovoracaceae bacterium]